MARSISVSQVISHMGHKIQLLIHTIRGLNIKGKIPSFPKNIEHAVFRISNDGSRNLFGGLLLSMLSYFMQVAKFA